MLLFATVLSCFSGEDAPPKGRFDLPADRAETSLKLLSEQSGVEILFPTDVVAGVRTNAVRGEMTARQALDAMLVGTGLVAVEGKSTVSLTVKRGTPAYDAQEKALGADQSSAAGPSRESPEEDETAITKKPMKRNKILTQLAALFALVVAPMDAQTPAGGATAQEEVIKMSPFVVSTDQDIGYQATSTLAGTRINTPLRDIGASISIITPEFLADTASTNVGELLSFTTGTEVGGIEGNFAGGAQDTGRPDQSGARENPQDNQRIRGIGPATNTRDFFLTDIPFDSYNTSRVTISRGPNALLFGIGNPAGIIEASLNKAQLNRHRTEIATRYGSNDSYRGTLDFNRVLVKDRLALRLASVGEQNNFDQEPAFDRKKRVYGAVEAVLRDGTRSRILGKTTLRGSFEAGDRQSTPVNVIPPTNAFSIFFEPPDPAIDSIPGVDIHPRVLQGGPDFIWAPGVTVDNRGSATAIPQNFGGYYGWPLVIQIPLVYDTPGQAEPGYASSNNPALAGISGIMGRIRYTPGANGRRAIDAFATRSAYFTFPGFATPTLQDRGIFDYRKQLTSGGSNRIEQKFDTQNAALTQEFFEGRGGIELAYDRQKLRSTRILPFSFGQQGAANGRSDIYIDVSQYLSNDEPNPNVGRPFMLELGLQDRIQLRERESFRATAFYRLDLEDRRKTLFGVPLGNHTLTGLFNTQTIDVRTEETQLGWDSATRDLQADVFQSNLGGFRRKPMFLHYLGPSVLGADSLKITTPFSGRAPRDGDTHRVTFFDFAKKKLVTDDLSIRRFLDGGSLSRQDIQSKSLSMKSNFFGDTLVTVFGWRWDWLRTYSNENNIRLPDGSLDPDFQLSDAVDLDEEERNFTWSVVGRYPEKLLGRLPFGIELSGYYNESGNFNPVNVRTNLNGNIIPAPAGETKEYGVLVEFFERRAALRLNWFETLQTNSSNNAQGATGETYGFPNFLIGRYRAAEIEGIEFSTIPGVTAAGYTSYQQLYAALFQILPEPTNTLKNFRFDETGNLQSDGLQGLTDTSDLSARGFEAEMVGNLTQRWRVSFNIAKQETVLNGSARLTKQVANAMHANLEKFNLLGIDEAPALPERQSAAERFERNIGTALAATVARDGAVSQEQRKWRANFVTTYDLRDLDLPVLNRMSVGTAVRWQSKIAIGNPFLTGERLKEKIVETNPNYSSTGQIADDHPVMQSQFPDLKNPYYGPEELAGDFWVSYRRRIFGNIDWRLQLNVRNAWGNDDDIPVTVNPDGRIAVIRIPNETRWYLTSTFSF